MWLWHPGALAFAWGGIDLSRCLLNKSDRIDTGLLY